MKARALITELECLIDEYGDFDLMPIITPSFVDEIKRHHITQLEIAPKDKIFSLEICEPSLKNS